jgi:hypothetical protein
MGKQSNEKLGWVASPPPVFEPMRGLRLRLKENFHQFNLESTRRRKW